MMLLGKSHVASWCGWGRRAPLSINFGEPLSIAPAIRDSTFPTTSGQAAHPELRLWQALAAWSGYKSIHGEGAQGSMTDLFHGSTKGPNQ